MKNSLSKNGIFLAFIPGRAETPLTLRVPEVEGGGRNLSSSSYDKGRMATTLSGNMRCPESMLNQGMRHVRVLAANASAVTTCPAQKVTFCARVMR